MGFPFIKCEGFLLFMYYIIECHNTSKKESWQYFCQASINRLLFIIWKFNSLRAMEPHMIFTFSDDYYETRIGLHTYINGDIIKGYYESGRINRFDSLESEKAWLSMMGMPMFCCDSPLLPNPISWSFHAPVLYVYVTPFFFLMFPRLS